MTTTMTAPATPEPETTQGTFPVTKATKQGNGAKPSFDLDDCNQRVSQIMVKIDRAEGDVLMAYLELGEVLNYVKENIEHGQWMKWLKGRGIDQTKANRSMALATKVAEARQTDPNYALAQNTTLAEFWGHGEAKAKTQKGAAKRVPPKLVAKAISDLSLHVDEKAMSPCSLCHTLQEIRDQHQGWAPNMCLGGETCQFEALSRAERDAEEKAERLKFLRGHPVYKYRNAVDSKHNWKAFKFKERYGQSIDEAAQELGYERGTVPRISNSDFYDRFSPTEKMLWDIVELKKQLLLCKPRQINV